MTCLHPRVPTSAATRPLLPSTQKVTLEQDSALQVGVLIAKVLLFPNTHHLPRIPTLTFFSFIRFCKMMLSKFSFHVIFYYLFWDTDCALLIFSVQFFSLEAGLWTILGFIWHWFLIFFFPVHSSLLKAKTPQGRVSVNFCWSSHLIRSCNGKFYDHTQSMRFQLLLTHHYFQTRFQS